MIPQIIHYCWFGGNPKPELIEKCIASWHKFCPDWEIVEWNESNWDVSQYGFAKTAYEAGKWAFVSDVARLDVLFRYGGVYLDTDVEVLAEKPFNQYLKYGNVMCFENERGIASGLFFGAEKGSALCERFMAPYVNETYSDDTRIVNTRMNEPILRELLPKLKWNAKTQEFGDICIIGCEEYGRIMKHYGTRSWCDDLPEYHVSNSTWLKRAMRNPDVFEKLEHSAVGRKILPVYTFLAYDLQDLGPLFYLKLNINKIKRKLSK